MLNLPHSTCHLVKEASDGLAKLAKNQQKTANNPRKRRKVTKQSILERLDSLAVADPPPEAEHFSRLPQELDPSFAKNERSKSKRATNKETEAAAANEFEAVTAPKCGAADDEMEPLAGKPKATNNMKDTAADIFCQIYTLQQ